MSAPPSGAKKQVLIVEDSIEEVFLMRSFLEKGGQYHVTTAQDGDAAERLIKSKDFDLVVTDLNLPGKDGYEVIRLVKAKNKRIPVLATTGYTATHLIEAAHRAGADHVMNKPLDRDEFLKEVAELLGAAAPAVAEKPTVLAIGALPGDIEGGSGGTLIGALSTGHSVLLLPLSARLDASDVLDEALRFAARIAQNGPLAVQAIKRTVRESDGIPIDKAFGIEAREGHALNSTRDAVEGPLAFIEKRPANFEGR